MKYTLIFLLTLSTFTVFCQGKNIELIKENFKFQENCWNAADIECYMKAYAPEGEIKTISRAGVTSGHGDILASYKQYFPKDRMGQLHFDDFDFLKINSRHYYVVGRFNLKYDGRDELVQGYFSVLMKKTKGKWYIIRDHNS